jgi:hypothetical protein
VARVTRPPALHLGDAHNFGRRVALRGDTVHKPRTLLWEWLLLSRASPLRTRLCSLARRDELGGAAFDFLPDLRFVSPHARGGGDVERVTLAPLPRTSARLARELAGVVGRALALFSWLGVSDLHWENLVLGAGPRGEVIFAPLDIEMILGDLALPTETKLLPDADPEVAAICQHACGVRRVLPYLGKPLRAALLVQVAAAYLRTLDFLDRNASAIAEVFARLPRLRETPIRVLLRGTDEYVRARSAPGGLWPPLLAAEEEQLSRGDIPYFFRLYGRPYVHYYADRSLTKIGRLPLQGDVPRLGPLLSVSRSRGLRSPRRRSLREDGLFALLGAFDHPSLSGAHAEGGVEVTFARRVLVVKAGGEQLEAARDMSAFVTSVYSPCRCGEVRTVFVPPVTRCHARA